MYKNLKLDKVGISEGSEIFFSGLFAPSPGKRKDYPLLRFGKISSIADEKIEIQRQGESEKPVSI